MKVENKDWSQENIEGKNVIKEISEHPKFHQEMKNTRDRSSSPLWKRMQNEGEFRDVGSKWILAESETGKL